MRVLFLLPLLALVINAGLIGPAQAQAADEPAAESANTAIPAMPLGEALNLFAERTGLQLVYVSEVVVGLETQGAPADLPPDATLRSLLQDTGLDYRFLNARTVTIASPEDLREQGAVAGESTVGQRRPGIEEIIVTGQKREERIQDVPIAISAFSQQDLTTSQIAGGPDLHLQVPNMTFTKTNFTGYSIQIRGIGTQAISATTDPAVAVALNNTPFIRNRFFEQEFYDLERVEVLRGPQGTLFGRNATAGVVNLITAKPKFQHESMLSLDMGNYHSRRWEGMVNLPIVEDSMALRIAGAGTKRDGYVTNEITNSAIDGRDLWSSRVSLRIAPPNGSFDATLIWEHFEEDDDRLRSGKQLCNKDVVTEVGGRPRSPGGTGFTDFFTQGCTRESLYSEDSFQTPQGSALPYYNPLSAIFLPAALSDPYVEPDQSRDLRVIESTVDPDYRARSDIGELQISYELTDTLTLDSETAYSTDEIFSTQDLNRFNTASGAWTQPNPDGSVGSLADRPGVLQEGPNGGIFCDPQIGCADRLVAVDLSTAESSQFSQELRLSSQFSGPFNFSLGANFLRYDTEDKYYVFINSLTLQSAVAPFSTGNIMRNDPYVPGVTDNSECLMNGLAPSDPTQIYGVAQCVYIDPNPIGSLNDKGHNYFLSKNPFKLRSYAVFGETYWNITDALKLTAGLRWSVDDKEAPRIPSWTFASNSFGHPTLEVVEQKWREPTGRLVLDWKPSLDFTDETLLYGSISRGYKAGGSNPPPFVFTCFSGCANVVAASRESATKPKTFDAEFVDAFEIGTKNTLADGAVTLNLAAFYYDYEGYQISEIVDRSAFNRNFDAKIWGAELEADWWVRENLRLGLLLGYEKTRIADGEQSIDLMDRAAGGKHLFVTDIPNPNFTGAPGEGRPRSDYVGGLSFDDIPDDQEFWAYDDWEVIKPFPTFPSNCVLPTFIYVPDATNGFSDPGEVGGGNPGGCETAYLEGIDVVTQEPFEPLPTSDGSGGVLRLWDQYPGWDPSTVLERANNGEGFFKDLSGNELPNAPDFTATFKVDYIIPLRGDWIMTAHTDIYWQSESWWRIFNDHEYNRLDDYFTMNLAAIFANDVSGWNIMAYIKNVTDEDAITGAFLYSDDLGLPTNVFLVEPQLFGIRATKRWDGGGPAQWVGQGAAALLGKEPGEPSPFSLTVGGQLLRPKEADNQIFAPEFISAFDPNIDPSREQGEDLGWGDGREIVLTYAPENGWRFSLGARFGESNRGKEKTLVGETLQSCIAPVFYCAYYEDALGELGFDPYESRTNYGRSDLTQVEEHLLVDFQIGREVGIGGLTGTLSAGLRYAHFESQTDVSLGGTPNWSLPPDSFWFVDAQRNEYDGNMEARREFEGVGPVIAWESSSLLFGNEDAGHLDIDWALSGGVLFGKQDTSVRGGTENLYFSQADKYGQRREGDFGYDARETTSFDHERDDDSVEAVPTLGAELGLTYRLNGGSIGLGYSWERYYGVIDGGIEERKTFDRTIEGPYLKVTFGGGS